MPTPIDDYLFDLQGYLVLNRALPPEHVRGLNRLVDGLMPLEEGAWRGGVTKFHGDLMNIFEAGEPFETLIDLASWLGHLTRYVGGDDGLFIDEAFVLVRGPGQGTNLHSGGDKRRIRTQFRYHDGRFRCGQVNVLLALTDCGPGDGAPMVIPGSHKSNLPHPQFAEMARHGKTAEGVAGAVEVHLEAGDALLFVDCLAHGSARRISAGDRRAAIYRYGPASFAPRYGYVPSEVLLARLTPERRRILLPTPPVYAPRGNPSPRSGALP